MMKKGLLAAILGLVLVAGGCYPVHQVVVGETPPAPPSETAVVRHSVTTTATGLDHVYGGVPGWYLVSAPNGVGAGAYGAPTVWRWNSAASRYEKFEYLESGRGYWAKLPAGHRIQVQVGGPQNIWEPLSSGWNMISVGSMVSRAELRFEGTGGIVKSYAEAVAAGWIRPTVWGYQASEGNQYHGVEILNPWYGYFVFANQNLVFLGGGGVPGSTPDPQPDPTPGPMPVRRISALEARQLAAVGIDVGVLNVSTLEFFDIYTQEAVGSWVTEYRSSNPPPAWPEPDSAYEEQFALWVRQRYPNAAIGSAVLQPPQAAFEHGYDPGRVRPWAYAVTADNHGVISRSLIDIRRALAFRWTQVLGGSWVKL